MLSTLDKLTDDKLTGFALRLVLTGHTPIPSEKEIDFLAEAEAAFVPPQPKKTASPSNAKKPAKTLPKQTTKPAATAKSTVKKPTAKPAKA